MGVDFFFVCIVGFLYTGDRSGLEQVSFAYQFVDTFRVRLLGPGYTLQVSGLAARDCIWPSLGRFKQLGTFP